MATTDQHSLRSRFWLYMKRNWQLYLLLVPVVTYFIVFLYFPMYGIQIAFKHYSLLGNKEQVKEQVSLAAEQGKMSQRFILCPSAGYMEYVQPTKEYIENLLLYLDYRLHCLI